MNPKTLEFDKPAVGPKTAREILDIIDDFFVAGDKHPGGVEQGRLWDILTALRGPDAVEEGASLGLVSVKDKTTIPIRAAAFPKTAAAVREDRVYMPADFEATDALTLSAEVRLSAKFHFMVHVEKAKDALKSVGLLVTKHSLSGGKYTVAELEELVKELKAKEEGK